MQQQNTTVYTLTVEDLNALIIKALKLDKDAKVDFHLKDNSSTYGKYELDKAVISISTYSGDVVT